MKKIILIIIAMLVLGGCASANKMVLTDQQQNYFAKEDKVLVVFLRPSGFAGGVSSTVVDVSKENSELVAVMGSKHKIAYYTNPGKSMFMVVSENADFIEADLQAGKIYYAVVTPRMGVWKARFSLHPIKEKHHEKEFEINSKDIREWLADTSYVKPNQDGQAWFEKNIRSINKKRDGYLEKWNNKLEQDKVSYRLLPQDGVDNPIY